MDQGLTEFPSAVGSGERAREEQASMPFLFLDSRGVLLFLLVSLIRGVS